MADELVDIVNENDELIGEEMKNSCHEKGIFHRVSATLIFNSENKLWLQTRKGTKIGGELLDYTASGHVPKGDNYENSAYREMKEEIGIHTNLKLMAKSLKENIDFEGYKIRHMISVYTGKSDGPFKIQEDELEKIELYEMNSLRKSIKENPETMTEGLRVGLKEYLRQEDLGISKEVINK